MTPATRPSLIVVATNSNGYLTEGTIFLSYTVPYATDVADMQSQERLLFQEASVQYLAKTHQLQTLKRECIKHRDAKEHAIYPFTIRIDFAELTQIDATLGNLVLHQPQEARKIFQEVCYTSLQCLNILPPGVSCSQVVVNLQMSDLPQLKSYQLTTSDLLSCKFESRFYQFIGTVCSISSPAKYSRCAKYRCPETKCLGAADNFYIRCHIEGAREHQTVRRDFNCLYCGSILIEDVNFRVLGERVTVQMVEGEVFSGESHQAISHYRQSVTVVLRDEFVNVELGGCYRVIGIPCKEFTGNASVSVMIEANHIIKVKPSIQRGLMSCHLPECLRKLLTDRGSSVWSSGVRLAYLFAGDVSPPGTYQRLKLCMLLSLVDAASRSSSPKDSQGFLDLVAVGKDTNTIHKLLLYGAYCAPCAAVIHRSSQSVFASLGREANPSGNYRIEGGSILLAHQGLCVVGDLDCLKKDIREKLQNVLENRVIHVDLPRQFSQSTSQQQLCPVQCSLWGYGISHQSGGHDEESLFSSSELKTNQKQSILESFPMILMCDSTNSTLDEHAELSIIRHTLLGAMQDSDQLSNENTTFISQNDMKQFLELAAATTVEFPSPARQLLKGYFVGSRRLRSSGVHGTAFPPTALQTLACMSRALAKLSLRDAVLEEDAALAVLLYEETVTARHGYSVLNIQPKPHFRDGNITDYLGQENDAFMESFLAQLSRFCRSHVPHFSLCEAED